MGTQPLAAFKVVVEEELKKAGERRGQAKYDSIVANGRAFGLESKTHAFELSLLPYRGSPARASHHDGVR